MYQFYLQEKSKTTKDTNFERVEGYQLLNGLAAHKLHDQTWTITDSLSGAKVLEKQNTLADANKILNTDEMKAKIEKARSSESYKKAKKTMYDYVMGLEEKDRVDGWKRYVRGNK